MELGNISAVLLMDLSVAFDTVNNSILLETFDNYYGINGQVFAWLKSYLSERSFCVSIDKCLGEDKLLTLSLFLKEVVGQPFILSCMQQHCSHAFLMTSFSLVLHR